VGGGTKEKQHNGGGNHTKKKQKTKKTKTQRLFFVWCLGGCLWSRTLNTTCCGLGFFWTVGLVLVFCVGSSQVFFFLLCFFVVLFACFVFLFSRPLSLLVGLLFCGGCFFFFFGFVFCCFCFLSCVFFVVLFCSGVLFGFFLVFFVPFGFFFVFCCFIYVVFLGLFCSVGFGLFVFFVLVFFFFFFFFLGLFVSCFGAVCGFFCVCFCFWLVLGARFFPVFCPPPPPPLPPPPPPGWVSPVVLFGGFCRLLRWVPPPVGWWLGLFVVGWGVWWQKRWGLLVTFWIRQSILG